MSSRDAEPDDLAAVIRIEQSAWPAGPSMRASPETLERRINNRQLVVTLMDDEPVGYITCFRPSWVRADVVTRLLTSEARSLLAQDPHTRWSYLCDQLGFAPTWDDATGNGALPEDIVDDDSDVAFAVGVATDPKVRGRRVADHVLRAAQLRARRDGARYFVGYGRLPGFGSAPTADVETYMRGSRPTGEPSDLGMRIHWRRGARPLCVDDASAYIPIPGSMPGDTASDGWGFLVTVPLVTTPGVGSVAPDLDSRADLDPGVDLSTPAVIDLRTPAERENR